MKARGKTFLSDSFDEAGSVSWEIKLVDDRYDYLEGNIKITDCDKAIYLDFDCHKKKHVKKRIDKIQKLIDELEKAKQVLVDIDTKPQKKLYY